MPNLDKIRSSVSRTVTEHTHIALNQSELEIILTEHLDLPDNARFNFDTYGVEINYEETKDA